MEDLPDLPDITRLSPRVIRILGGNPSKYTLQGTNTYLIGTGKQRILIDTGEGKTAWTESLQKTLHDESASVDTIILTHWHPDHVGGVKDARNLDSCKDAKVYKSDQDAGTSHVADGQKSDYAPDWEQINIEDGEVFRTEGATLKAVYSPGHTVDHMAFILEEESAMFTADNVLGHGTAVFEDLAAYMNSLEIMRKVYPTTATPTTENKGRAYPGHGEVISNGLAKIDEYIAHRKEREQQVLTVLKGDAPDGKGKAWKSMGIVKIIYKDYPEHLHQPAEGSVVHILKKMEADGRVRREDGGRWSLTGKAAL